MAATTTLLGLVTPTQGTLTGTWGDTVNYGISDYVDISVAGTLTLTNDGAVTLANTTGSSAGSNITSSLTGAGTVTAQFAIVRVTGTLTVAKVVTGPSYSKTYTVVNAATGGIVTFKASGQTGISVAVGESAFVYFNGTDYVKLAGTVAVASFQTSLSGLTPSTATTGAVTLAGTLGVASGGTGLTAGTSGGILGYTATGTLASSVALTANALVLGAGAGATPTPMASLGTTTTVLHGNASGAPTFGAVSLTADVTGVLPTANGGTNLGGATPFTSGGVVYASSTSALATGSALTFDGTNLGVTGNTNGIVTTNVTNNNAGTSARADSVVTSDSADIRMIATSAAYTGVTGWADSGIVSTSSGSSGGLILNAQAGGIKFNISASEVGRFDTSGNLGIGTSSPTSYGALGVGKAITIGSISVSAGFSDAVYNTLRITHGSGNVGLNFDDTNLIFQSGGISPTTRMTLTSAGNLQLSTASTGIQASDGYTMLNQTPTVITIGATNRSLNFATSASATAAILDNSGNLGLGVTPSAWSGITALQVKGGSISSVTGNNTEFSSNVFYNGTNYKRINDGFATAYHQYLGTHRWNIAASSTAGTNVSFTQALTLSASGELLVGTTTNGRQDLNSITLEPKVSGGGYAVFNHATGSGSGRQFIDFAYAGTSIGSITQSGTTATAYNTSSDYRLKNITGPITTSGAYIDSLNPVEGTWKADGSTFVGLIAHEIQEASRTQVATGTKDGAEMQAMDYSNSELIANLIAEVKSLRQRVATLEAQ